MALIDKYRNLLNRADTAIDKKASQLRNAYSQRIAPRQSLSKPMFQYSNATNTPQYKMLDALTRYQSGVRNKIQSAERATTPLANRVGNVIEPFEKIATRRLLGPVIEAPAIAMMNDQQRANLRSLAKKLRDSFDGVQDDSNELLKQTLSKARYEFNKPRVGDSGVIGRTLFNPTAQNVYQNTSYAAGKFAEGVPVFGKQVRGVSQKLADISGGTGPVTATKSATEFGRKAGAVAELIPATMTLGGLSKAPTILGKAGSVVKTGGTSAVIGGGLNKAFGGTFTEGAKEGYKAAPVIQGMGMLTNPLLAKSTSRVASQFNNPLLQQLSGRVAAGGANVLQGIPMNKALNQPAITPLSAGIDFATGLVGGKRTFDTNIDVGRKPSKVHPEDVGVLDQAMDILQNKKVKLDSIADTEYGRQINLLADKYLKKEEIDKIVAKTKGKDMRKYYVELGKAIQKKSREVEPDYGFADKMFGKLGIVDDDPLIQEARKYKSAEEFVKAQQFKKISMENPMIDSYHLGIRDVSDIKSYKEALNDPESFVYPDFTKGMAEKAMRSGEITIYSSKPLDKSLSQFVTPSKMMASDYAGNGKVYSKKVSIDDIAWINGDEGNFVGTSQLTDIWNKAQQITPPQGSMGFVGNNPMQMGIVGNSKNQDFENFLKSNEDMTKTLGGVPAPTSKYAQYEQNPPRNQQNIDETIIKNEFETNEIPKVKYALNQVLNPLKNTPKEVQEIMQKWRGKTLLAKEMANKEVDRFAHIPEEDGFKLLKYIQNPTPDNAKLLGLNVGKYANDIAAFRQVYDQMRAEGMKRGIPTNYVENYLNQVWKQSPKEISKAVSLSGNPAFTKMKTIPDYQTGMALGLTPKFTHPAQLVAHYRNQLERAVANNDLVNELKGSGYLLPSKDAPIDWKTIEDTPLASGLAGFKASPEIAKSLNNLFSTDTNMLLSGAAKVSRGLQDMTMTGGAGPVNSFTLGNAIKDITAGRVRSPVGAFVRSWSGDATKKFFKENRKYTQMMAGDGIALHTNTDYSNVYKNLVTSKSLGEKFGRGWNLVFNEATFKRFMPMLQLNMYKDTYEGAIKQGLSQAQARQLASQTTKSFYGVIDNFTRSNDAENAVSSLIFAPKFRESMINFWVNNIKSLDVRKPEYKYNRRFLVGTVITAVLMDRLNLQLNGRHMYENKDSKELSLEIPVGEGRSWFIPILPSISTLPRRAVEIGGALAGGDIALATERAGTFASTPLQLGADVLTNKTFYGAPIYDEDEDSALTKVKKTAGYAIEQSAPGFIGEPVARIQGRKTTPEMILGALEMPVYPSKSTDVAELSAKEIKKYNELTKTNPRQAEVFRQQKSAGKSKGNNLVPDVQAKGSSTLPAGDDLAILYKGLLSDIDGARNKRVNIQYDYTLTDEEKELKMEELRNDIYEKSRLWKQIKKEKPYEVFKIELDKYSNADVEERAAWAMSQIEDFVARGKRDAIPRLLETMWQAGVLTSGKKGSAQYIADNFGIDVSTRTKSASGAKKAKKLPTIKLTKAPDFAPNVKAREVEDIELSVPTFTAPQSLSGNSLGSFTPRANLEKIRKGSLTR